MKRLTLPLLLLVCTLAVVVVSAQSLLRTNSAAAQVPKAPTHWEYASLVIGDAAADIDWLAGRTMLKGLGDVARPDLDRSVQSLFRQLGGKGENANLGMLLNLIGRDGWEMVSYSRPPGAQTWMFKRTSQ
jgi:hypothetical protein